VADILETTDGTFDQDVLGSELPVVVDFWAPWCGPCRAIAPIIKEMAEELDSRVKFVKLNVDDNPVVASRYNVLSIPTLILFAEGEARATVVGARPRKHFEEAWAPWLQAAA
jgi:thioredoxin 1